MAETVATQVGQRIRKIRKARGWSLDDLAARTHERGLVKSQLGKIENGAPRTSADQFAVIAAALGVPLSRLFRGLAANVAPRRCA